MDFKVGDRVFETDSELTDITGCYGTVFLSPSYGLGVRFDDYDYGDDDDPEDCHDITDTMVLVEEPVTGFIEFLRRVS